MPTLLIFPGSNLTDSLHAQIDAAERREFGLGLAPKPALADRLLDASHQIHAHPELNYEEHFAHELLTGILEAEGLEVQPGDELVPAAGGTTRAITIDAAWQCRADDITGSIEVGKYADIVLLEDDPSTVDPTSISGIGVSETRLAGATRHRS